jgi:hypothetical protein
MNNRLLLFPLLLFALVPFAAANNTLYIWTTPQTFDAGKASLQLLDTFSNHVEFTANTTVSVTIQTLWSGAVLANYTGTHINFWWNLSQGCNDYFGIIATPNDTPFTIHPNITAVYNPSPYPLGSCNTTTGQQQLDAYYAGLAETNPLVQEDIIDKGDNHNTLINIGRMMAIGQLKQ